MDRFTEIRDWMFRALTFDAESDQFRRAGIRLGSDREAVEVSLLEESLAPFSIELRQRAIRMARLYTAVYVVENSFRILISDRLTERAGADWWEQDNRVPKKVKEYAEKTRDLEKKSTWVEGSSNKPIEFISFSHLVDIVIQNWSDFSDIFLTQHWLRQKMDEIEKARNWIAHNRFLLPNEFSRMDMHIRDWSKVVT